MGRRRRGREEKKKKEKKYQVCWHMSLIPALKRQRQENSVRLRLICSTQRIPGKQELHSKSLS